jgi:hypothetical protein
MEIEILQYSFRRFQCHYKFNLEKDIDTELFSNPKIHPYIKKIFKSRNLIRRKIETHDEEILNILLETITASHYFNFILRLILTKGYILLKWGIKKINFAPNRIFINKIILAADEKIINILNNTKFFRPYHPCELLHSFPHLVQSENFYKCNFKANIPNHVKK